MRKFLYLAFFYIFISCSNSQNETLILVSKDNHQNIKTWLTYLDSTLVVVEAYKMPHDSVVYFMENADGFVIGGGEDVNPTHYNKPEYAEVCGKFDLYRDTLELMLIAHAMENKVPILGICRGHQVLNVANGGTLIPDIPSFTNSPITHAIKKDYTHSVKPEADSWLKNIIALDTFMVNSRHHQAVDDLAPNLKVSAYAPDSIIEAIEISDKNEHPFAVGVQWHPESLRDSVSNLIGKDFLVSVYGEKEN